MWLRPIGDSLAENIGFRMKQGQVKLAPVFSAKVGRHLFPAENHLTPGWVLSAFGTGQSPPPAGVPPVDEVANPCRG